jgi:GNAT superfamily N-acetyltransferase
VSDSGVEQEAVVHVVTNADLRAPATEDDSLAGLSANKRSALLSNPLLGREDEPARILLKLDDCIAGRLDLVAGQIEAPGGTVPCFWGSALQVSESFRGRGLGATLLRAAEGFREAAAACAPSRMSRPVYERLGYFDLPLGRHILIRRTGPLVEPRLGTGALGHTAAAAGDFVARGHRGLLGLASRAGAGGLGLEHRETFPAELGPRLLERRAPFSMHRSAAWIDWVVRESFADAHRRALYVVTTSGGESVAYVVLKARVYSSVTKWNLERFNLGSLVDWRIFEPKAVGLEQLILLTLDVFDDWGVAGVEVCVPPESEPVRLRRLGFLPGGAQHVVLRGREGSALAQAEAREARAWSVRPGEGDHAFS